MQLSNLLKDRELRKELILYTLVGILGTVVDFAMFYLALFLHAPLLIAQWLAALTGFTHNHLWQHYRVFKHNQAMKKTYSLSLVMAVISIAISGPLLLLLNQYIQVLWINKMLIISFVTIIQYIIRKKWIFTYDGLNVKTQEHAQ